MKIRTITQKFWLFGPITGLLGAILITLIFTLLDWVRNFSEVFRDQSGTHWPMVYETAISWFVPGFIYLTLLASLGHLALSGLRLMFRWYQSR
jgi:hypothetical protein